jgi:hypothetical protein
MMRGTILSTILSIIVVFEEKANIAEVRFKYDSPCGICGKRSGNGINFQSILIYLWEGNIIPNLLEIGLVPGPIWTAAENIATYKLAPPTIQPVLSFHTE